MKVDSAIALNPLSAGTARRLEPTLSIASRPDSAVDASASNDRGYDRIALLGVGLPLFAEVFVQKLAIPLGGSAEISPTILLGFAGLALLVVTGRAIIDTRRFILYCVMILAIVMSQLLGDTPFSTMSLTLMVGTYIIYVFRLRDWPGNFRTTLRLYQSMTIIVAVCGVLQYVGQFFLPHDVVFPLEALLGRFLIKNFAHLIPITYGSPVFKSNGVFMAEPSYLSQAMALSFIIERLYFRRLKFQIAYLAGLA